MSDKSLKISVKSDLREGAKLTKFLQELQTQGNKTAKAMSGITIGGAAGVGAQRGALYKSLLENKKAFESLGKVGKDLARVYKDEVNKEVANLQKNISAATTHIKRLTDVQRAAREEAERFRASGRHEAAARAEARATAAAERAAQYQQRQGTLQTAEGELNPASKPWWRRDAGAMLPPWLSPYAGRLGWGAAGFAAYDTFSNWNRRKFANANWQNDNAAVAGQAGGGMALSTLQGNLSYGISLARIGQDPSKAANFREAIEKAKDSFDEESRSKLLRLGNLARPTTAVGDFLREVGDTGANDQKVKAWLEQYLSKEMQSTPVDMAKVQYTQSKSPMRVAAARRLGSMQDVYDAYDIGNKNLIDEQQAIATVSGVIERAGRVAGLRLKEVAIKALAGGMSAAAAGEIGGAAAVGGGRLFEMLAGSGLDVIGQEKVGQFVANKVMNGDILTTGEGTLGMLAGYQGSNPQWMLQTNMMGMQAVSNVFGRGGDPYQEVVNTVNARNSLGRRAANGERRSIYATTMLAKMGQDPEMLAAMLRGEAIPEFEGMNITEADAKKWANRTVAGIFPRIIDQGTNERAMVLMRRLRKAARMGKFAEEVQTFSEEERRVVSPLLSEAAPGLMGNYRSSFGWLNTVSEMGASALKHKPGQAYSPADGSVGSSERGFERGRFDADKTFNDWEMRNMKPGEVSSLLAAAQVVARTAPDLAKTFQAFGTVATSAEGAGKALSDVAKALQEIAKTGTPAAANIRDSFRTERAKAAGSR